MDELNEIYNTTRIDIFSMAVCNLLDYGFRQMLEVTDEDIEKQDGNGLMTKEFVQMLIEVSRRIARACDNPVDIIRFCQKKKVFDVSNIKFK